MLLVMGQELTIAGTRYPAVKEVVLDSGRNTPSDTLTIRLPRYRNLSKDQIRPGAPVTWAGGYFQTGILPEFQGKVTEVSPKEPIEVTARDDMHDLTVSRVRRNFFRTPLAEVLNVVAPGKATDVRVSSPLPVTLRAAGRSGRFCLWELRRVYGWDVYFRGGVLVVESIDQKRTEGRPAILVIPAKAPEHRQQRTEISFIIEDNLEARPARSVAVLVKSEDPKTGLVQRAVYGTGTETVEVVADGLTGKAIQDRAKEIWDEHQAGLTGSFTTFGIPVLHHSDLIQIRDENDPTRDDACWIDRVVKTYSGEQSTYRQEVHVARLSADRRAAVVGAA